MKRSEAFPSAYFGKDDVGHGPVRATIADVRLETVRSQDGEESKPVIYFREKGLKAWIVNVTCWKVIEEMYGENSDLWIGKPLELYHDPGVMLGPDRVGGVRVRIPSGAAAEAGSSQSQSEGPLALDQAVVLAIAAGMTQEEFYAALKTKGLTKGYSPTKDADLGRGIIAAAAAEVEDTIPF